MGHIFCLMGKSASGKDTIFGELISDEKLELQRIVPYTTRPAREGERQGDAYYFTDVTELKRLTESGKVVEQRCYHTYHGDWYYFTVDDGNIDLSANDYILICTPEAYGNIRDYFGKEKTVPLYIFVDDGLRLQRALDREKCQKEPKYEEMCRRFLADAEDFSGERLDALSVTGEDTYDNIKLDECLSALKEKIWTLKSIRS